MLVANVAEAQPEEPTLFMTGQLIVEGSSGRKQCQILIDSGSKLTYISKRLSEAVGVAFLVKEKFKISAFAGAKTETISRRVAVELGSLQDPKSWYSIKAYEAETISDPLLPLATGNWLRQMQKKNLSIADDPQALLAGNWNGEIDLPIGSPDEVRILTGKTGRIDEAVLEFETIFGWVVWG